MKRTLITIFLIINTSLLFSQSNNVENIKSAGIKSIVTKSFSVVDGKKQLLDTKSYDFDVKGNVTTVKFDTSGFFNKIIYKYDTNGNIIEEKMYKQTKNVRTYKYEYNISDKKESCVSLNYSEDQDVEINYTYDNKGNLVQEESLSGNKKFGFKYVYDKNSRKTEMVAYNPTKIEKKFYYYYDAKGLLIEEKGVLYWAGSKTAKHNFFSRKSFKYNDNKELIEMSYYLTDQLFEKYLYFYNEKGLLAKYEKYNTAGILCFEMEYNYE